MARIDRPEEFVCKTHHPAAILIRRSVVFWLGLLLLGLPLASRPQDQQPIRVAVNRVNVGVIVTDSRGNFVEGLRSEDFHVFDDGTEQPVTDFAAFQEPGQVLLLIEAGPAVYFLEAGHLQAARALLDGLSSGDRVAVVKYDDSPQPLLDFTPDKAAVASVLANVRFNIGFGMLNLSQSLSSVLDWLAQVQGKKTIVLLSTGIDTSPANELATILTRLKISDVRVLSVSLSAGLRTPSLSSKNKVPAGNAAYTAEAFAEADRLLTQMAEATGGRAYFPKTSKDFSAAYSEIAQLVRHEYSIAFAPPASDGKLHTIEVRVSPAAANPAALPPAYRIDYRRAYHAPAAN